MRAPESYPFWVPSKVEKVAIVVKSSAAAPRLPLSAMHETNHFKLHEDSNLVLGEAKDDQCKNNKSDEL